MTKPDDLVERLRAAKGPDRDLDILLGTTLGGWTYQPHVTHNFRWHDGEFDCPGGPPAYTASVDAALALVERCLPGWMIVNLCEWEAEPLRSRGKWLCQIKEIGTQDDLRAPKGQCHHAPTAPLAILTALLTAMQGERSSA